MHVYSKLQAVINHLDNTIEYCVGSIMKNMLLHHERDGLLLIYV